MPHACIYVSYLHHDFIKKETLVQIFSCEFSKIGNNTFFTERLRTTASVDLICAS